MSTKPENPDRIEVPQVPIGDTSGPEWHNTGRTTRIPLPIQLTDGQIRERQREGRALRREARARLSDAARAKAVAASEFKAASTHFDDVSNKCATIDREVETERAMRDGKVQFIHRYPDVGGLGFEIMVRQDPGYENMRYGDERALKPAEWAKQASVPGTVTPPAAEYLSVVRSAILDLVTADDWLPTDEIVKAVVERLGDNCEPDVVNSALLSMAADCTIRVRLDDDESSSYKLVGDAAEPESADGEPDNAGNEYPVHKWLAEQKSAQTVVKAHNAAKKLGMAMDLAEFTAWLALIVDRGEFTDGETSYQVTKTGAGKRAKYSVVVGD